MKVLNYRETIKCEKCGSNMTIKETWKDADGLNVQYECSSKDCNHVEVFWD